MTKKAFTKFELGNKLTLQNRIVMAPMSRGSSTQEGNLITQEYIDYYTLRAKNEVGLIISEGVYVNSTNGFTSRYNNTRLHNQEQMEGYRGLVEKIHETGSKFAVQLWHCGPASDDPIGPIKTQKWGKTVSVITKEQMAQAKEDFVNSAKLAKEANCDAIELHAGGGFLLDAFISLTNDRKDGYGSTFEGRIKYPLEVIRAVREAVGEDFPLIYRVSQFGFGEDFSEIKWRNPQELKEFVLAIKGAGIDIIHVCDYKCTKITFDDQEEKNCLSAWAQKLSGIPVIATGGMTYSNTLIESFMSENKSPVSDPEPHLALIENNKVDLVGVARGFINNPDWVIKVKNGNWKELKPFGKEDLLKLI
ncbi:putative binding oxidoreductase [Anaeramoeba flamelloides]|uniref:Binding oxidoreductase n=1 Tax=Anaeramoeba flamelloides TaxID=1746091 RepID=A0AAV8A9E7_9EUKA|nr:putative binding oxidoreductase [Anaeramoeba flamelloides]|eukprot:Anaeramoba_flamelloidesa824080_22.p1 GENE.a824080_22~~a824080_22.p1  ORF type:complete len:369 (+),score=88.28 a824080_22:24-1109(+)